MTGPALPAAGQRAGAPAIRQRNVGRVGRTGLNVAMVIVPVVAFVGVWWAVTLMIDRPRIFAPPPLVAEELIDIGRGEAAVGSSYRHIGATMYRLFAAFSISMVIGSVLGILAGRSRFVFDLMDNIVWIFMAVPSVVWVFIFVVSLGITDVVPIAAVSALLTPMVLVNVAEGAKSVPSDIMEMTRSYKAGRWQRTRDVFIPFLVPYFASSARVAFALGIKLIIIAEVVGLTSGIGYEVKFWHDQLIMAPIIAWGVLLIAIGIGVDNLIFAPIERRASAWKGGRAIEVAVARVG